MGKSILKALVFCVLFLAVCGLIGLKEEYVAPEQAEVPQEPDPEIVFSNMEVLPGGCFVIYIKGMTDRDEVLASTTLVQEQPSFFKHLEGSLAIVGLSCRTKEGDYKYKIQVKRDGKIKAEKEEVLKAFP